MRIEVDGLDATVSSLHRDASTFRPKVIGVVLAYAERAAEQMHQRTTSRRVRDAITADTEPTISGPVVSAAAGPDRRESSQAFIARFLEGGTVAMTPRPFAAPTMDVLTPGFARDLAELVGDDR